MHSSNCAGIVDAARVPKKQNRPWGHALRCGVRRTNLNDVSRTHRVKSALGEMRLSVPGVPRNHDGTSRLKCASDNLHQGIMNIERGPDCSRPAIGIESSLL